MSFSQLNDSYKEEDFTQNCNNRRERPELRLSSHLLKQGGEFQK